MDTNKYWDAKHLEYADKAWIDKPTLFAEFALKFFLKKGKLLELGCGQGQDSRFYAKNGFQVLATDFSRKAINLLIEKSEKEYVKLDTKLVDLSEKLPFKNNQFDVVYSHLALHYFNQQKTKELFNEIARVLKSKGVLACLLNTIEDPEIANFEMIENGLYKEPGKIVKRYFSVDTIKTFIEDKFEIIILDAKGETYKDEIKTLIRFIGKKK